MDWVLAFIGAASAAYIFIIYRELAERPGLPTTEDVVFCVVGIVMVLEAKRRALGPPLMIVAIVFMTHSLWGAHMPEIIAHHYTEAGLNEQSVEYWQKAGEQSGQRSAHVEAISHLHKGLELLSPLPETSEHVQKELDLQVALGTSLMVTKGWSSPDVGHVYSRAHTLCQQIEADSARGTATGQQLRAISNNQREAWHTFETLIG